MGNMPKITGSTLMEHREQTRARLFAALSSLMRERGFDAVTLSDIAATAGVGRTAVYNHFPDKEALLVGFINHETERYVVSLAEAIDGMDDPVDQLRTYVRTQAGMKRDYFLAPGPALQSVLSQATRQQVRMHVVKVAAILRKILEQGIASGVLPDQDIDMVVALVNGCVSGRGIPEQDGPERDRAVETTVQFVMRAVGAREEAVTGAGSSAGLALLA